MFLFFVVVASPTPPLRKKSKTDMAAAAHSDNDDGEMMYSSFSCSVPSIAETRAMTIDRLLRDFDLCDIAGRLSIIEHAISKLQCTKCALCQAAFTNDDYKVIPCLCRLHVTCLKKWLQSTKDTRPRICPYCATHIEDEGELWNIAKMRDYSYMYHFGNEQDDGGDDGSNSSIAGGHGAFATAKKNLSSDESTDDDSPKAFYPRAKVPHQSPRRKTKARLKRMKRALTEENLISGSAASAAAAASAKSHHHQ